jgi:hypothetical protein
MAFPYDLQFLVLTSMQRLLEKSCFEFTAKHKPALLSRKGWSYSESLELHAWAQAIMKDRKGLPGSWHRDDMDEMLVSMVLLRHDTVHRKDMTAAELCDTIALAVRFMESLGNEHCSAQLSRLQSMLTHKAAEHDTQKSKLEVELGGQLDWIAQRQAAIVREKAQLIEETTRKHDEYMYSEARTMENIVIDLYQACKIPKDLPPTAPVSTMPGDVECCSDVPSHSQPPTRVNDTLGRENDEQQCTYFGTVWRRLFGLMVWR